MEEKIIELENDVHIAKKKLEEERKSSMHWKNQFEKQANSTSEIRQLLDGTSEDRKLLKEKINQLESENLNSKNQILAMEKNLSLHVLNLHNAAGLTSAGNNFAFGNQGKERVSGTQFDTAFKDLEASVVNLNSKVEVAEAQKAQIQKKFSQEISSLQNKFQIEITGYQNEISELKDNVETQKSNSSKVSRQLEESKKKLNTLEAANLEALERIRSLNEISDQKDSTIKATEAKIAELKARLQQSETIKQDQQSKFGEDLLNTKSKFSSTIEELEKKIAELSESVDYYKSVNSKLSKAVDDARKKTAYTEETNQNSMKLEEEILAKNSTLKDLESALKDSRAKIQVLQQKYDEQKMLNEASSKAQSQLTDQLNENSKTISDLQEELAMEKLNSSKLSKAINETKRKTMLVAASTSEQEEKISMLEEQLTEAELDFKRKLVAANNQIVILQEKERSLVKQMDASLLSAEAEIRQKFELGKVQILSLQEKEKNLKIQLDEAHSQIEAFKLKIEESQAFHKLEADRDHGGLTSLQYQLKMTERELISEKAKFHTADLNWQETIHHNQVLKDTIAKMQTEINSLRYKYDLVVQEQTKLDFDMQKTVGSLQSKISEQRQTILDFRILQQEKEILLKDFESMKRLLEKTAAEKLELEKLLGPKEQPNGQVLSIEQLKSNYIQAPLLAKLKEMEKEMEEVNSRLKISNVTNAEKEAMVQKMMKVQKQHYTVSQKMQNQFEHDIAKTSKMLDSLFKQRKRNDDQRIINENLLKYTYEKKIQNLLQKRRYSPK